MMELIAVQYKYKYKKYEFFMCGIFSSIDVLLNQPMGKVLADLPLVDEVTKALLNEKNLYRIYLDIVFTYEVANWKFLESCEKESLIDDDLLKLYIESYEWASELDN